jgi:hypothetical protein
MEVGTSVSNELATAEGVRNGITMDRYINRVHQFQPDDFVSTSLQEDMSVKLYNAKKNMTGERLSKKLRIGRKSYTVSFCQSYQRNCQIFPVVIN